MAGRTLGEAWVTISPDTAKFRTALKTKLDAALKGFTQNVNVGIDLNADTAALRTQIQAKMTEASKGVQASANLGTDVDMTSLAKSIAKIAAAAGAAKDAKVKVKADVDTTEMEADVMDAWLKAQQAVEHLSGIKVPVDNRALSRALEQNMASLEALSEKAEDIKMDPRTVAAFVSQVDAATGRVNNLDDRLERLAETTAAAAKAMHSFQVDPSIVLTLDLVSKDADQIRANLGTLKVNLDDPVAKAELAALQAKASAFKATLGTVTTDIGVAKAEAQLALLNLSANKFRAALAGKGAATPALDLSLANAQFTHLVQQADDLKGSIDRALSPSGITLGKVTEDAKKNLEGLSEGAESIYAEIARLRAQGGITTADDIARVKTLSSNLGTMGAAVTATGVAITGSTLKWRGWVNTVIDIARVQIPLFNGAFEKMLPHFLAVASGTHMIIEAALELVAVWVPAAVALGVFGIAASKAALEVANDTRDMAIAADGTGTAFAGMSKKVGESMTDMAKPYVFEAFGLGMIAMQKQSQTTGTVIQSVGGQIDKWLSEAVIAYQKGTGQMALQGSKDFSILGDAFKQLGTAIEGFIKITPGYASDLLKLGDSVLHVASAVLNSGIAQAFGKIFLAAHGAFFYLGLFATLGTKLGQALLSPLARITGLSTALGRLGVNAKDGEGKMSGMINAIATGWNTGTGKLEQDVKGLGPMLDDGLNGGILGAGEKAEKSTQGVMSKLGQTFVMGMSTVGTAVKDAGSVIGESMMNDVEGSFTNTSTKFSAFKTAASDAITSLGSTVATSAKGIKGALAGMLGSLGINPWLLGLAAIGVGIYALTQLFKEGATAAQNFGAAAATALGNASLSTFGTTMKLQTQQAQAGLDAAKQSAAGYAGQLDSLQKQTGGTGANMVTLGYKITNVQQQMAGAKASVAGWQAAVSDLQAKNATFNSNLSLIAKTAGTDLPTALTLATQAGIPTKNMMTDTGVAAKEDAVQVQGLTLAYSSLVSGTGNVSRAYQAMNIQNSQTMKDAQSVASAFQNYTTLVTGGVNAFDTFTEGQATLASNLGSANTAAQAAAPTLSQYLTQQQKLTTTTSATGKVTNTLTNTTTKSTSANKSAAAAAGAATLSLGKLSDKISLAGASLDGITPASVAANQAFLAQVNNAQALYGSLLQLSAASGNTATAQHTLSVAGKDMISTLVNTAGGSKSAMTQVYALAQTFGYAGSNTLPNLVKWLGTTGDKTGDLQSKVNGLTAAAGNMGNAAKALSGDLSGALNTAMTQSIVTAEGGQGAFDNFAKAVLTYNKAGGQTPANLKAITDQGARLAKILVQTSGSAANAEPVLQNYLQTLGVGKTQAQNMADGILGIGDASTKSTKPMDNAAISAANFATEMKLPVKSVTDLQTALGKTNFADFTKKGDSTTTMLDSLATGLGLNKTQSSDMFTEFGKANLDWLGGKTKAAASEFEGLLEQFGLTPAEAQAVWTALSKQNLTALTSNIGYTKTAFEGLGTQLGVLPGASDKLWTTLAKNNFNLLDGSVDTNKQKFMQWANQAGLTGTQASDMWQEVVAKEVQGIISGHVTTNESNFLALEKQLGTTGTAALTLWDNLKKAPNVKATVTVTGGVEGQATAVAQASGSGQKNTIGKLFFTGGGAAGQGHAGGGPITPGVVPGWHNTGDNMLAVAPHGPIALQGGEAIVPKNLSTHPAFTDFASKHGIPGFASGGMVPGASSIFSQANQAPVNLKTDLANSQISFAGDAIQASKIAAYDAVAAAFAGTGGSASGQSILADAETFKGHPYRWGGPSNPEEGWDCSSFVGYILGHDFHMKLPGGSSWDSSSHGPVAASYNDEPNFHLVSHSVNDIQAGDLLVEGSGGHVGFGVGPNKMFSAYGTAYGTIFSDAKNMTNIYRDGAAGGTVQAVKSGNPLIESMAKSAQAVDATSTGLASLFPNLNGGYGGDPGSASGVTSGNTTQNGEAIYSYLKSNLGMTAIAAAGAIGSMWGESSPPGWNPESWGTGGNGIMGWTPPLNGIVTGNATQDLQAQLPDIIKFVQQNGDESVVSAMNQATSVGSAAELWMKGIERAGISDVHAEGIAAATSIMNNVEQGKKTAGGVTQVGNGEITTAAGTFAKGGMIPGFAAGGSTDPKRKIVNANNPPAANPLLPEWLRFTAAQLKTRVKDETIAVNHDQAVMNKYFAQGNMAAYLKESQVFAKDTSTLGNSAHALTERTAYDKMTPAQQAQQRANADTTVATGQASLATQDLSKVNSLAARVINDKKIIAKAQGTLTADDKNVAALKAAVNLDSASVTKAGGGAAAAAQAEAQMAAQIVLDRAAISKAKKGSKAWTAAEAKLAADTQAKAQLGTVKSNDGKSLTAAKDKLKTDTTKYNNALSTDTTGNASLMRDVKNENMDVKSYNAAMTAFADQNQIALFWKAESVKAEDLATTEASQASSSAAAAALQASKLQLLKPNNQMDVLVNAMTTSPVMDYLMGAGSTSAAGWAAQPVLGDIMISKVFGPAGWLGKVNTDQEAVDSQANYYSAQQAIRVYLNSLAAGNADAKIGAYANVHGKDAQGRSFSKTGVIPEDVVGTGAQSGYSYKFHANERVGSAAQTTSAAQAGSGDLSDVVTLLRQQNQLIAQQNQLTQQQPTQYARALNQNVSRKVGR